jgi:scyllo-inositol 2-dehydrogenase (NADP+)
MKHLILFLCYFCFYAAQAAPVRVGVAGMTHSHVHQVLRAATTNPAIEVVGFAEPNRAVALKYLKQYNLPESLWFSSLEQLIAAKKPEVVCAFNSIFEHKAVVEICAPKGIHVMVEKPLAVNNAHAKVMVDLAKKHGIQLITNYETTWYASHQRAAELLFEQNKLGQIRKVVVHDGHKGPMEIGCPPEFLEWLTDPIKNGGGAIIDFGCYGANLMTWLMKGQRPQTVTAVTQQIKPHIYPKVDDEATIILTYPNAQAVIQASWNWPYDRKDIEIYAQEGFLVCDKTLQMRLGEITNRQIKETQLEIAPLQTPYNDAFSYLAAVVRGQIKPQNDLSSLAVNQIVVEILDAAVQSAKTKKTITLK